MVASIALGCGGKGLFAGHDLGGTSGVKPTYIRLADIGIKGNSHVMMLEKNNKEIAAVIAKWLDEALPANE